MELNINQAASYLNCSVDTVRRRIRGGQLQARLDDRGRYMITFTGDEAPDLPMQNRAHSLPPVLPTTAVGQSGEGRPGDWFDSWPEPHAERRGSPPGNATAAIDVDHEYEGRPSAEIQLPPNERLMPLRPDDHPPLTPQRRATDPGLNEQVARLREEREELVQELQMWRDEAMAAKVALEELRRLIPQTLTSRSRDTGGGGGGLFRKKSRF